MFNLTLLAGTVPNAADYPVPEGALDKLGYGLQVALVGMGTVFFVLFLLMFVVYIFKLVFYTIPQLAYCLSRRYESQTSFRHYIRIRTSCLS